MLSYRHAFHAGNHADILKHAVVARIAGALAKKDKPFSYIDTHAGAGIYSLEDEWAKKTGEAARGIVALLSRDDYPEAIAPYVSLCREFYDSGLRYPGSPEIVRSLSRDVDQLILMELHPSEIENLRRTMGDYPRVHVHHRDGYAGLSALCPPDPRRGFALMDPSYETADDYEKAAVALLDAHKKWPVGILALWYPILARRERELFGLKDRFQSSGIPGILSTELLIRKPVDGEEFGLLGSGMLIAQPPWKLDSDLEAILPYLASVLGERDEGSWNLEWLAPPA